MQAEGGATVDVIDPATGEVLPEVIDSATGDFVFSPDSQWIFWTNRDDNGRPDKIFRRPARGGIRHGGALPQPQPAAAGAVRL